MRLSRPFVIAGAAAVLAVAYTAYWSYAADLVRNGIEEWIAEARQNGTDVQLTRLSVDGFPFAITARATDVRIARPDGLNWESALVEASALPWSWRRIGINLPGGQRVVLTDAPGVTATAETGRGELLIDSDGRLVGAEMTLDSLAVALPGAADLLTAETVAGAWTEKAPERGGAPVVTADIAVGSLVLPRTPLPDLGSTVQAAKMELTVTGPLPPRMTEPHLAAWRNGGGVAAIDLLTVDWGPLSLEGAGVATLDMGLQPTGSLTADVTGFVETVDALVAAGHLETQPATFAKAGLTLLAGPPGEDGRRVLTVPVTLEDRALTMGPLTLGSVPHVEWPEEDR